jgi:two-component system sensor histidine kinase KdpD
VKTSTEHRRPDPEALLRQVQAAEEYESRGRLKIFLGYASGVGKSHKMLDEGRRRHDRGQDVVVGAIQPKIDREIAHLLQKLEIIPLQEIQAEGVRYQVMDLQTILRRHPSACLVDGLAYDNPPDAAHAYRWQDVEQLLTSGISVITTINLGYIKELQDDVERVTGRRVAQTVPVEFIRGADEIEVVDAPASACIQREGATAEDIAARRHQFAELREVALVLAADVVDRQLERYLERSGVPQVFGTQERVMVCLTPRANGIRMLEVGRRIKESFHGELIAGYVDNQQLSDEDKSSLETNLELARKAGAKIEVLSGSDPMDAILEFAKQKGITQLFVGHSMRDGWKARLFGSPLDRLLRKRQGLDVRVFPH